MIVRATIDPKRLTFGGGQWTLASTTFQSVEGTGRRDSVEMIYVVSPEIANWVATLKRTAIYDVVIDQAGAGHVIAKVMPSAEKAASVSAGPNLEDLTETTAEWPIAQIAHEIRLFLETEVWSDWLEAIDEDQHPPGATASVGMCRVSSPIVRDILTAEYPNGDWKVVGGHPSVAYVEHDPRDRRRFLRIFDGIDGGMWDRANSQWDGHYWVRGHSEGLEVIVDVTADQYGWDPVVVTAGDDARYRANYAASELKADLSGPILRRTVADAVAGWTNRTHAEDLGTLPSI